MCQLAEMFLRRADKNTISYKIHLNFSSSLLWDTHCEFSVRTLQRVMVTMLVQQEVCSCYKL